MTVDQLLTIVGSSIRAVTALLVTMIALSEWQRTRRETFRYMGWAFILAALHQGLTASYPAWVPVGAHTVVSLIAPVWLHLVESGFIILLAYSMAVHERGRRVQLRRVIRNITRTTIGLIFVVQVFWYFQVRSTPGLPFAHYWGYLVLEAWDLIIIGLAIYLAGLLKPGIQVLPALALLATGKTAELGNAIMADGSSMVLHLSSWMFGTSSAILLLSAAHFGIVTETFTDPLTTLPNRRYFSTRVVEEFERAARRSSPISILVMDLDLFKRFNDTHGHVAGDKFLRSVSRILLRNLRPYDILFRWGGEEFVALLPDTQSDTAVVVAERLRQAVADVYGGPEREAPVTISIGVAAWPESAGGWREVVEAADEALYKAKRWRNRVVRMNKSPQ